MGTVSIQNQRDLEANIPELEKEMEELMAKLHTARPLEKIRHYEEIKALKVKLAKARRKTS